MGLIIQTPFKGSDSLIDALNQGARGSISGGGIYAFASSSGIELFFDQKYIIDFFEVETNTYHLIVGVDEITNKKSLSTLKKIGDKYSNLKISVFYHEENKLFHPKFSWFKKVNNEGLVIIGSGNLTNQGVSSNWEAFFSIRQNKIEFENTLLSWDSFVAEHDNFLLDINNENVEAAAERNGKKNFNKIEIDSRKKKNSIKPQPISGAKLKNSLKTKMADFTKDENIVVNAKEISEFTGDITILIREAMTAREKGDYSQILFSEYAYNQFFSFSLTDSFFYEIYDKNGYLGQVVNPSITVKKSRNYSVGIASKKEGKSKGRAERKIKSNFMINPNEINDTTPIILILKYNSLYKVIFSHPSNGLNLLHRKLNNYLNGNKEKILDTFEVDEILEDFSLVKDMIF